ncbi:hypothetical protein AAG570_000798 [Ranatra chinensis]|uniref:Thymidine kinase n=1 Tax=Ranatra chinensis TaxID=642074 RepID=A0ABD0YY46_9HEMI
MFSGKTSEMIRRLQRYRLAGYKCLVIRYAHDTRYSSDSVATHDGFTEPAVQATRLNKDVGQLALQYSVIGIDEGQFFPDIIEFCDWLADQKKIVVVAGLDGTYQRVGFGNFLSLIPLAESVVKLSAVCMSCSRSAPFTKRISNDTEVEVIGGVDKYMAVCQMCYELESPQLKSCMRSVHPSAAETADCSSNVLQPLLHTTGASNRMVKHTS